MEKIKNILNPGSKKDDEVMYGSGKSSDPIHAGITSGQGSHFGSSRTGGTEPLSSSTNPTSTGMPGSTGTHTSKSAMPGTFDDDAASTASIKSGVIGYPQSGSTLTASSGMNDPLDTNKPLPREPASMGTGHTETSGSGLTGSSLPARSVGSSGYGNTSEPIGSNNLGRDATLGAGAIGAGGAAHHHAHERDNPATETGRSFPLGGSSTSTSGSGYPSGSTTAGPHSSSLANKADPRVDSNLDGSRGLGSAGYGSGTGPTSGTTHQGNLGRDAALGAGAVGVTGLAQHELHGDRGTTNTSHTAIPAGAGYGPEHWQHEHNMHGHAFEGDPCGPEAHVPGPHFTRGPHATDTANLLDPHVASPIVPIGSAPETVTGSKGTGLTNTTGDRHLGRDAAMAGGAGAAGVGAYESSRGSTGTATGPAPNTAGPHKSDMMNKMDPRVDSDLSKQQGSSGIGGTSSTGTSNYPSGSQTTGRDHHLGRDAGLTGAGGAAAYEAEKHHHSKDSDLSNPSRTTGTGGTSTLGGASTTGTSDYPSTSHTTGRDHHLGRDAGLVGAGGAAAYGVEKHSGSHRPVETSTTGYSNPYSSSNVDPRADSSQRFESSGLSGATGPSYDSNNGATGAGYDQQTGTGHHYGRDAGLVGAGGVAGYEADKHLRGNEGSRHNAGLTGATAGSVDNRSGEIPSGHHYGRDAGLAGAGVGAGGVAAYEAEKHREHNQPTSALGSSTTPTGHGDHHIGRDAALGGGSGAAVGTTAGSELSKKEAEKLQKEQLKEHKHHVKEEEKALKKHDKQEEHDDKHHDSHDGKKHGGILGLFHRDKPDKDLKDENLERQGLDDKHHGHHGTETAAGVGAAGATGAGISEYEKHQLAREHDRNRLHKDPPTSLSQSTNYAEAPKSGYASQVTGGTGTTALAEGDHIHGGSHLTSAGNKMDPNVAGRGDTLADGRAAEPHTGLPIDLSKGTGAGGTDGGPVEGYHTHNHGTHGAGTGTGL